MDRSDVHLLKPAEVVELLGISRSWLYDAANSGRIPCVRLGSPDGPVRFRLRELEAWIDQGRVIPLEERRAGGRVSAQGGPRTRRGLRGTADDGAVSQLQLLPAEGSDVPDGPSRR
jgi:excisionase family DNA binding protein